MLSKNANMRNQHLFSLLAVVVSLTAAQNMVPTTGSSTFPACAVSCPILLQAQTTCTPPTAILSNQLRYDDCFCQMPTLVDLYTTGETLCTSQCTTTADRQLLSTWFVNFCKEVGQGIDPVSGSSAQTTLSTVTTTASSTQQTATSSGFVESSSNSSSTASGPWIKTHWQWVVMLVVLFFGLLGLGLGARWLKRRHDMKTTSQTAAASGFPVTKDQKVDRNRAVSPELWGPHQHMAATKGYQYTPGGVLPSINEDSSNNSSPQKSKEHSRVEVTEIQSIPPPVPSKK